MMMDEQTDGIGNGVTNRHGGCSTRNFTPAFPRC
jgi:hypothetical protein